MNVNQIKTKIFLLKAIDIILVICLLGAVVYSVVYAENKEIMFVVCLVGLFIVNTIGRFAGRKVAILHVQLEMIMRDKRKEEQRTLMSTRHTRVSKTGATSINTKHTDKP